MKVLSKVILAAVAVLSVAPIASAQEYNGYITNGEAEKLAKDLAKLDKAQGKEKSLPDRVREKIREVEGRGDVGGD